jgi:Flp pilus assembly pilin Flp
MLRRLTVNKLQNLIQKLKSDERGLSTVEYVVLLVLIVAIAVALWNVFGNTVTGKLSDATKAFDANVSTDAAKKAVINANGVTADTAYSRQ